MQYTIKSRKLGRDVNFYGVKTEIGATLIIVDFDGLFTPQGYIDDDGGLTNFENASSYKNRGDFKEECHRWFRKWRSKPENVESFLNEYPKPEKVKTIKMWQATDEDRTVSLFKTKPSPWEGYWVDSESIIIGTAKPPKDWRKTLKRVKVTIEEVER